MAQYSAVVTWQRDDDDEAFIDNQYSRAHQWQFDGGAIIAASSSPHIVPLPYSVAANVDPEEAFIAALSSCHMLFFLGIAAKKRYLVKSYTDEALGVMETDEKGMISMTKVTLRPYVEFDGERQPSLQQLEKIHHQAHQQCFIANSVKSEVVTEIRTAL